MGKFEDVKKMCLEQGILYEDRGFPLTTAILYQGGPTDTVQWKRPKEISRNPQFSQDGETYDDLDQGEIGNCWFIASVCCIAASPQKKLIDRIVPNDQGFGRDYCGAFRFHFWQYGKWVEVVVDDRLPTVHNKLIYGHNKDHPNEFWCPLLEKAFAKLYGSYHALDGGFMDTCLVDLTGGIGERLFLADMSTDELRTLLVTCHRMNSVIGGGIIPDVSKPNQREVLQESGLYAGHAYTVIDVIEVTTKVGEKVTLLHIRNPWGSGEWKGAWADGSQEWKTLNKKDLTTIVKRPKNDGAFWMSIEDFRTHFTFAMMAHLTPDAYSAEIADNLHRAQWKQTVHHGSWVKGVSAGGPLKSFMSKRFWGNPQFKLSLSHVTNPTTVIIQLMEANTPASRQKMDVSIGFVVFKMKEGKQPHRITTDNYFEFVPKLVSTSGGFTPASYRDVTGRFVMEPTDYVIVPCTRWPGQEAEFYMRIFSEQPVDAEEIDGSDSTIDASEEEMEPDAIVDREFDKLSGHSGGLDAADMQHLLGKVMGSENKTDKAFRMETCRCVFSAMDVYKASKLANKSQVEEAVAKVKVLTKLFKLVDSDDSGFVEKSELRLLFNILEYKVSYDLVDLILTRYGGRKQRLSLEDFLQVCCKLVSFSRSRRLAHDTSLNHDELLHLFFI